MPKLQVFAPCEKVIISQDENNPTLIAILSSISLQTDAETLNHALEAGPDGAIAMAPLRWAIFSMWQREDSDGSQEFTQTVEVESPSGKIILSNRSAFTFSADANNHRITLQLPGFPVRESGPYIIRTSLDGKHITDYRRECPAGC